MTFIFCIGFRADPGAASPPRAHLQRLVELPVRVGLGEREGRKWLKGLQRRREGVPRLTHAVGIEEEETPERLRDELVVGGVEAHVIKRRVERQERVALVLAGKLGHRSNVAIVDSAEVARLRKLSVDDGVL